MLTFTTPRIHQLNTSLKEHPAFASLHHTDDIKIFMEHQIFLIWSFVAILKALQSRLTCVSGFWIPVGDPSIRQMINELVCNEESNAQVGGLSKFEWFLQAMIECKASTVGINNMIEAIQDNDLTNIAAKLPNYSIEQYISGVYDVIQNGELHEIAAAFAVEREHHFPVGFYESVEQLFNCHPSPIRTFRHYLERHFMEEAPEHGPLTLSMLTRLCDNSDTKYQQCLNVIETMLENKVMLFNEVYFQLTEHQDVHLEQSSVAR